jgi:MarR family transcriptional regulator, 2-MHQ and catechol-resistance regulon repressor
MNDLKTITILFRATNTLSNDIQQQVNELGLSLSSFMALEALYHKGAMSVASLQSKVLIANSSLSYVIDQLAQKGYISVVSDAEDKRKRMCSLTASGHELMSDVYEKHVERQRIRLNRLTPHEEQLLQHLLKKIGLD